MKALLFVLSVLSCIPSALRAQSQSRVGSPFDSGLVTYVVISESAGSPRPTKVPALEPAKIRPESAPLTAPPVQYSTATTVAERATTDRLLLYPTQSRPDKFSFENLLDGIVYDFKKPNGQRLEFGGPGIGEWELTRVDEKNDIPFIMLLLLNTKF